MLKDISVEFITPHGQSIRGTFRALVVASCTGNDILIVGNKQKSLLFRFKDLEIKLVTVKHTSKHLKRSFSDISCLSDEIVGRDGYKRSLSIITDGKERVIVERFRNMSKRRAYSLLMALYLEYKNKKSVIETEENIDYEVIDSDTEFTEFSNSTDYNPTCNPHRRNTGEQIDRTDKEDYKPLASHQVSYYEREGLKPALVESEKLADFFNKILVKGYKNENYWQQGYSGQLDYSS